jgi:hypothetical protein
MKVFRVNPLYLLAVIAIDIHAQQLEGINQSVAYPGLSDGCMDALNTTVASCPIFLDTASVDSPRLNSEQLASLCTVPCQSAMASVTSTIKSGCSAPNDTITIDAVVYPGTVSPSCFSSPMLTVYWATFIIDRYRYTYDLSCRKDVLSGRYCDELMFSWLAAGNAWTNAVNCSDCSLGSMQTQLNSPFGFDEDFAQQFQVSKASCGSSDFPFTTPTAYAVGTNLPNRAEDASIPSCSNPYVIKSGGSCDAIALVRQVSTFSIIKAGGLKSDCSNLMPSVSLCLPDPCTVYRV